jgi:hypothetical protein
LYHPGPRRFQTSNLINMHLVSTLRDDAIDKVQPEAGIHPSDRQLPASHLPPE